MPEQGTPPEQAFIDGVVRDLDRWRTGFDGSPDTLYFGGGTPSRLSPDTLITLIEAVGAADVTIEANPEDLTEPWLNALIEGGVHRVSLGVQSMIPRLQRVVGRAHHDPAAALARLEGAALKSWSADLMFGLPGQTLDELDADLDRLLAHDPPHVSLYDLTIESGTGFGRLDARRALDVPDEATWATLQDRLVERLEEAGLERYEVSNFARPGHRSRHNMLYWTQQPYLGAGPSAHGFASDGRRWVNADWASWRIGMGPKIETPSPLQAATDALIAGLRGVDGIHLEALGPLRVAPEVVTRLQEHGLLRQDHRRLTLTKRGFDVSDAVLRALTDALSG